MFKVLKQVSLTLDRIGVTGSKILTVVEVELEKTVQTTADEAVEEIQQLKTSQEDRDLFIQRARTV